MCSSVLLAGTSQRAAMPLRLWTRHQEELGVKLLGVEESAVAHLGSEGGGHVSFCIQVPPGFLELVFCKKRQAEQPSIRTTSTSNPHP